MFTQSSLPYGRQFFIAALLLASALAPRAVAQTTGSATGESCLFIGHSFFVPVASQFDDLATTNSIPGHMQQNVFSPGPGGSPAELWNNPTTQAQIAGILATGQIDLLGMTTFSPTNSTFADFAQWIDLALLHNPDTRFFIGQPWTPAGPNLMTADFDQAIESQGDTTFAVVESLRLAYPSSEIVYLNYGKTASIMKGMFEANLLPDITQLVGIGPGALFSDGFIGHGGPMMLELSALTWLETLYGADAGSLSFTAYQSDAMGIVDDVLAFNAAAYAGCGSCVALRGDFNADGALDIADPIEILNYLFATGPRPGSCVEAGDVDGDTDADLSDAIQLLGYLFSAGPAPASPGFPTVGCLDP